MRIVIEYVLLENMLINLISLKTTALLTKERGKLFLLSAFLGACLTVMLPALNLTSLGCFLIEIGLAMIYICLSFKFRTLKKFVELYLAFFVVTFIYGGACYFFESFFGITSMITLLGIIVVTYLIVKFLLKYCHRKKQLQNFCFDVDINSLGKVTHWKAFLDSGNFLYDPITQSPVSLINFKVFKSIFNLDIEDVLTHSKKLKELKFAHYISFNTLNNCDKILVFQVDSINIGGKIVENPVLGLSLKNFNQTFGTDIILHNNFAL